MDRLLRLTEPVLLTLEPPATEALRQYSGSGDPRAFLLQQLADSVWGYPRDEQVCLSFRNFTARAGLRQVAGGSMLAIGSITESSPEELSKALGEGCRIAAPWRVKLGEEDDVPPSEGARQLWNAARRQDRVSDEREQNPPRAGAQEENANRPRTDLPGAPPTTLDPSAGGVGAILPQSEIDLLVASLRQQVLGKPDAGSGDTKPVMEKKRVVETFPMPGELGVSPAAMPRAEAAADPPPVQGGGEQIPGVNAPIRQEPPVVAGVNMDEWLGTGRLLGAMHNVQGSAPGEVNRCSALLGLLHGHQYTIVTFDDEEQFTLDLDLLRRAEVPGTLLAFWGGQPVETRLGPVLQKRLDILRSKYRAAAAALESSITRARQSEQLRPNLEKHREQQASLVAEGEKVASDMRDLHLKQVLATHEGRLLSRRVFAIEARRRRVLGFLAQTSYALLRRPAPSFFARSSFRRAGRRLVYCQGELESSLERLSALERETQRRLEYQADWQALIRRQVKIQREQDESARFVRASALAMPGCPSGDVHAIDEWIRAQWDSLHRREKLLHAWLDRLTEVDAWALRAPEEPVALLGDASMLARAEIASGAHLIMVARQSHGTLSSLPDECASWVVVDPTLRIASSGLGTGTTIDPLPVMVADMAKGVGIDLEDALHALGLGRNEAFGNVRTGGDD